jgi:ring-1,2-phenylacetyl-CoA epoxidase subunit PaaE
MTRFHDLRLLDVRRETMDSVSLAFEVPEGDRDAFTYVPGQYLTLRAEIEGHDVRRSYSICSGVNDGELRVAIKRIDGGAFSAYANDDLKPGDRVGVMPPDGRFLAPLDPSSARTYVGFGAGSGITPLLAILKSVLEVEPLSRFSLFLGNRDSESIMFRDALEDLKNRYPARFSLMHVLSREARDVALLNGRLDAEKCGTILRAMTKVDAVDGFYLCGPEQMVREIRGVLGDHGVAPEKINYELFTPSSDAAAAAAETRRARQARLATSPELDNASSVTVILDGASTTLSVPRDGESILDIALRQRPDMPFACKGGMCCTCRARVVEGEVEMDINYTLAPDEIARGFVLTCQSHPVTDAVVLDYDAR